VTDRYEVHVTDTFFEELDRQLPAKRSPIGNHQQLTSSSGASNGIHAIKARDYLMRCQMNINHGLNGTWLTKQRNQQLNSGTYEKHVYTVFVSKFSQSYGSNWSKCYSALEQLRGDIANNRV